MKHTHDISFLLRMVLVSVMSIMMIGVRAQDIPDLFEEDVDTDVQVKEYNQEQSARIFKHNSPLGVRYTKKHPLVIVGNWTFNPYSFVNDHGEPDGFHVDILKHIFASLHVPYTIQLMDWKVAKKMVCDGRAQLMVGIDNNNNVTPNTRYGATVIAEYKIGVLHSKETPRIRSILLLKESDTLYVQHGDYVDIYLKQYFGETPPFHIEHIDAEGALKKVQDGSIKYFAWGVHPLKNLVRKYGETEDLRIDDIDIPSGRMRFFSNDTILLHELDLQFQHIKVMQLYEPICYKWFVNDGKETSTTTVGEITLIVFAVIFIVLFIIAIIVIQQSEGAVDLKEEFRSISNMAINMTQCNVVCVDVKRMWVNNISGTLMPENGLSMHDYEALIHPDDIRSEYEIRKRVDDGAREMPVVHLRLRRGDEQNPDWRMMSVAAIIRQNRYGRPKRIYLIFTDETEHKEEQMRLDMALRELSNITEITELGYMFYDASGNFVTCNDTAIDIFNQGGLGRAKEYLTNTHLQDFPVILNGITIEKKMDLWFCAPVDIPELNLKTINETRLQSVYDDNNTVIGYEVCIRNIDEGVNLYRGQKTVYNRLRQAKKRLTRLHMELRFMLRRNKMSTFRWRKGNDFLELSHDLLSFDRRIPIVKTVDRIILDDKTTLYKAVDNPEEYFSTQHNEVFCIRRHNSEEEKLWLQVFTVPDYDKEGNLIGAFGIQCDITDIELSQENLRKETEKAQNSGRQKTVFLANMTHELRTPLNAISGFAEVLMCMDSTDDRQEYIDIMRHNSTMLIHLIDNILQISMMDTDGVKLRHRSVDFAHLFPVSISEMKYYITSPEVKLQIDTPLPTLTLDIDYEHVMQVVDAFVNNASKFTEKGFIRVGYRYMDGVLTIYCRDTGCGIPEDMQQKVFERFVKLNDFVQGTGLGLAVCKMIADRMGATIDIYSREGEGTNISFNLPCAN